MSPVVVIIVTYNNRQQIGDCLQSVQNQTFKGGYQVVVVDNSSTDNTAQFVQKNFPAVILLQNKNNGYAGGNNLGIIWAKNQGFSRVVLLNPDMIVAPDWLDELVKVAESSPRIGMVQAKVLFFEEKYRINTIGNPLHFVGFSWSGGFKQLSSKYLNSVPISVASGSSVLIKTELLDKIGLFNEKYFMYHEDVDLSWRTWLAGYQVYLAANAKAYHKYSFSFGTKKFYYVERNRLALIFTNYRLLTILFLLPFILFTEVAMLVYAFFTGWTKYKLKSWLGFVWLLPNIISRRWSLRKIRKVKDRDIFSLQIAKLEFEAISSPFLKYAYNPLAVIYFNFIKLLVRW